MSQSDNLKHRILFRIAQYEKRRLRLKVAGFGAAALGSLGVIALGAETIAGDASQSGFSQFAPLFFSNFSGAMASFSDFALSLVESFPVFSAALLLAGVFAAIWSAACLADEIAFMRNRHISIA